MEAETWQVESATTPGVSYTIHRNSSGRLVCECKGFFHRKVCWHVRDITKRLGIEENTGPNPLFLAACSYQLMGYHVIPVEPHGKVPLVPWKAWQEHMPSIDQLATWWTTTKDANVGIVLGQNRFALDLDGGQEAELLLEKAHIFIAPDTPRSKTNSGFHVFLTAPCPIADRIGLLRSEHLRSDGSITPGGKLRFAQVDVRGQGLIIAPPSIHPSGAVYTWLKPLVPEPPQASKELLELIGR
jgi:hypothetical protein